MKLRVQTDEHRAEITILPMVNVVFLLLIFFMLVGRISPPDGIEVSPPTSQSGDKQTGKPTRLAIAQDGRMQIDGDTVDMTGLIIKVSQTVMENPDVKFQLRADANLDANQLIRIMETLRRSGVRELSLLTQRKRPAS